MIKKKFKDFFKSGHERSLIAKKNIVATFLLRGISMFIGFFSVRVILDYLGKEQYGIWIVLTSFFMWYSFFELGLGNGLRNKLAECFAKKNYELGKEYVSTTYFLISLIALGCLFVFLFVNNFINWRNILNTDIISNTRLYFLTNIIFGLFFVQFSLNILTKILYADQKPALAIAFEPIISLIRLILIIWLGSFSKENIVLLGIVFSLTPVVIYFVGSIFLFHYLYNNVKPSFKKINLKLSKDLVNLGLGFFIIGVGNLIILQLVNILIAQYYGPNEVTTYSIGFKLFAIPTMIVTIISGPLWSAYTEAWAKKDVAWVKRSVNKMRKLLILLYSCSVFVLFIYQDIINFWIKDDVVVPVNLAIILLINSAFTDFGRIHLQFTNGISKLRVQLIATIGGAILIIPLSYLFCIVFEFGLWGITLAIILSNFKYIFAFMQYEKILSNSAQGVWLK